MINPLSFFKNINYFSLILILFVLVSTSCDKHESNKYDGNSINLGFSKTEQGNEIFLFWNPAISNTLVEYIVTKNSKSTPALTNISDIESETILARIKNRNSTSIVDSALSFPAYYRLYLNYGKQVFVSEELFQPSDNYVLSANNINQVLVDHRKGRVYIIYFNQPSELIDLKKLAIIKLISSSLFFSSKACSLGHDKDGNTEIYMPEYSRIQFLDGDKLTAKSYIQNSFSNVDILSTITDENSNIYFSDWVTGGLGGISRYDAITRLVTRTNVCDCKQTNVSISKDGRRGLVGASLGIVNSFTLDKFNNIIRKTSSRDTIDWESNKLIVVASQSESVICGRQGIIYNGDFIEQKRLAIEVDGYVQSIFDKDEKYIYAIGSANKAVYKFENKSGYRKVASFPLKFHPTYLFNYDSYVFIIESVRDPNTGTQNTILERINI
jgi:hypothetical protein